VKDVQQDGRLKVIEGAFDIEKKGKNGLLAGDTSDYFGGEQGEIIIARSVISEVKLRIR
jgi:hypothetical protein